MLNNHIKSCWILFNSLYFTIFLAISRKSLWIVHLLSLDLSIDLWIFYKFLNQLPIINRFVNLCSDNRHSTEIEHIINEDHGFFSQFCNVELFPPIFFKIIYFNLQQALTNFWSDRYHLNSMKYYNNYDTELNV